MDRHIDLIRDKFDAWAPSWDENEGADPSLLDALVSKIPDIEKGPVLDVACGTGVISGKLATASQHDVLGVDLSPKMIEIAQKKYKHVPHVSFRVADFYEFKEGVFQTIVIHNAYPHFLDVPALMEHAAAYLKHNGVLAILHSCGREELNHHHSGPGAAPISFMLQTPEKEAARFEERFALIEADENEEFYYFILRKKA